MSFTADAVVVVNDELVVSVLEQDTKTVTNRSVKNVFMISKLLIIHYKCEIY